MFTVLVRAPLSQVGRSGLGKTELATFNQDYSAFSPEDLASNMVGIQLAKQAITRSLADGSPTDDATWNAAIDTEMKALMLSLGPRSKPETDAVLTKSEDVGAGTGWFKSAERVRVLGTSFPVVPHLALLRRNFDGTPWPAGMPYDAIAAPTWLNQKLFKLDSRTDFS